MEYLNVGSVWHCVIDFFWTFYFPAVAPPFSRSASEPRLSLAVSSELKNSRKVSSKTVALITACWRFLIAWMYGFNHRNFVLALSLLRSTLFTLLFQLLAFIVAFIEGCRNPHDLTRNIHVFYTLRACDLHVFNSFYPVFIVLFLFPYLILQIISF